MAGFGKEFKEFISRGNVMDMAVGVIIGGAFKAIVDSLVEDIINPVITLVIKAVIGSEDFSGLAYQIDENTAIAYGNFIGAIINFLLVALVLFLVIKGINGMRKRSDELKKKLGKEIEEEEEKEARKCPFCKQEIDDEATRCPHCTSELPVSES